MPDEQDSPRLTWGDILAAFTGVTPRGPVFEADATATRWPNDPTFGQWCAEHDVTPPPGYVNRSYWTSPETWCDPDCIECGGEGAPCCDPPDEPYGT